MTGARHRHANGERPESRVARAVRGPGVAVGALSESTCVENFGYGAFDLQRTVLLVKLNPLNVQRAGALGDGTGVTLRSHASKFDASKSFVSFAAGLPSGEPMCGPLPGLKRGPHWMHHGVPGLRGILRQLAQRGSYSTGLLTSTGLTSMGGGARCRGGVGSRTVEVELGRKARRLRLKSLWGGGECPRWDAETPLM